MSKVFGGQTKPSVKNTSITSDKLIESNVKKCHPSFGGTWSVNTYKKIDGSIYTKHIISCIKCDTIQNNLYAPPYTKQKSTPKSISPEKYYSPCSSEIKLTRHGYSVSPSNSGNFENVSSPHESNSNVFLNT